MATVQEFPELFSDLENIDGEIKSKLANIENFSREKPALVICHIQVPHRVDASLHGKVYGVYILTLDEQGNEIVRGVRLDRRAVEGQNGDGTEAFKALLSAYETPEELIIEYTFQSP